jgi:hypothetical protein
VILLASLLLFALAAPSPASAAAQDPALRQAQQQVTDAFVQADAQHLSSTLSPHMKTYVACPLLGLGDGYYGADQMHLLLRRLFHDRETVRFRILQPTKGTGPDGSAVVMAVWSYREAGAPPSEARLTFTFAREGEAWRVREIRELK